MMTPQSNLVAQGGAHWRAAWKAADSVARNEASSAVMEGVAAPRVEFAALAAGLAARDYAQTRFVAIAGAIAALLFVLGAVAFLGRDVLDLVGESLRSLLIGAGWLAFFWTRARRLRATRDANLQLLEQASRGEITEEPPRRSLRELRREMNLMTLIGVPLVCGWVALYLVLEDRGTVFAYGLGVLYWLVIPLVILGVPIAWLLLRRR